MTETIPKALDLSSLSQALESLNRALERSQKDVGDEELRDACIQRFEYSFELSYKMLVRFLEMSEAQTTPVDQLNFKQVLRLAAEKGLVDDVESWFSFRAARNMTSHTYDSSKAAKVYAIIPDFHKKAQSLLQNLTDKAKNL